MTYSKLPQLLKRVAFTLVACASVAVLSTEQASAQSYGNRGGSFGRGAGISVNIGNLGLSVGIGGNRGYTNNVKRPYSPKPKPKASYYRPPVKNYGLSLIHISEPTRQEAISYAVFCLKKNAT